MSTELLAYLNSRPVDSSPDGAADYMVTIEASSGLLKRVLLNNSNPAAILSTLIAGKGDLIVGSADDVVGILAAGTDGHILTRDSAQSLGVKWAAPGTGTGISPGIIDAKGDLIVGTANDTPARKPIGTDGRVLTCDSSQTDGTKWETPGGSVTSITDSATPTPVATNKQFNITALAQAASIAAPTGTPEDGQRLVIRIKDNGTARALTWNAIYRAVGITIPTTTVATKTTYVGFIYNAADSKWDGVAAVTQV